jgi:hypothetical protein
MNKKIPTKNNYKHRLPMFLFHAITEAVVPMSHNARINANTATTLQQRKKTSGGLASIFKSRFNNAISPIPILTKRATNNSIKRTTKNVASYFNR